MKTSSSRKWTVAGVAIVVLVLIGAVGTARVTSTDTFCIGCHAYEKISWDHGDHPDVGCISCHTKGIISDKAHGLRKVFLTGTGQVNPHNDRLQKNMEALTANCVSCHMSQEKLAAAPYYKERHEEYMKYSTHCVGCHEPGHVKQLQGKREVASRQ